MLLTFESVDEILRCDHSNKPLSQFFHMVLIFTVNTGVRISGTFLFKIFVSNQGCHLSARTSGILISGTPSPEMPGA